MRWLLFSYQAVTAVFKETLIDFWFVALQSFKILVVTIAILLLPIWLMTMPIDTYIQLDLVVDRLSFRVNQQALGLEKIQFHSVTLKDFQQVTFSDLKNTPVTVISKGVELLPSVLLETASPTTTEFGILQQLTIESPAKVSLAVEDLQTNHESLVILIEEAQNNPVASFLHPKAFQLIAAHCEIQGMNSSSVAGLSRRNPFITVMGRDNRLKIILDTPAQKSFTIFQKMVASKEFEFFSEDFERGQRVTNTTLLTEGSLSYPEYPKIEPITFKESNFVLLNKLDDFYIEQIEFDSEKHGLKLRLTGLATEPVSTYPNGFPMQRKDHRLTISETLGQSSKFIGVMLNLLIYLIPIIIGLVAIGKVKIVQHKNNEK